MNGSRDLLLEFWVPLHISATVEARNFKFGTHIGDKGTKEKNKIRSKGVVKGSTCLVIQNATHWADTSSIERISCL